MNNFIISPLLIPLVAGIILVIFKRNLAFQRWFSVFALGLSTLSAIVIIYQTSRDGIQTLNLGGWQAPFGIVLVADMFSALLVLTTCIVSIACLVFAFRSIGVERESHFFYPLMLFLVTGVNGSFLTGDLFNLFVFFEVMLLASYVLLSLGGTKVQLRESIKYVLINVISSALFLASIAYLYGMTGTLNFAHLSVRVAEVGQDGLMNTIALLFVVVFGLKAALFLFFWLPGSYGAPPTAIAAVFAALLTKVGIYALFRMFTLIFYHEPQFTHTVLAVMAALTMILGGIGAVAYNDIRKILAYNVIIAVGFIIAGLAVFSLPAVSGAVYYLIHDMLVKGVLFLLGGTVIALFGTAKLKEMSGLIRTHPVLGWLFFIVTLSLVGVPPFSGFIGKVFVTKGAIEGGFYWLAAIALLSSVFVLYSLLKIFMNAFWGETNLSEDMEKASTKGILLVPCVLLVVLSIALGLGVEWVHPYINQASMELMNPAVYIEAVLNGTS